MATDVESRLPEEKPNTQRPPSLPPPAEIYLTSILNSKPVTAPWIDNAMQRALTYQKTIQGSLNTAIQVSSSGLSEISSTSQAHFSQTIDSLQDVKSEFGVYEGKLFGNVKEGINVAASHPLITSAVAVGLGLVALKRPRQILYYKTLRLFTSEEVSIRLLTFCFLFLSLEALLSQADAKVKELQQSISLLKAESEKLKEWKDAPSQQCSYNLNRFAPGGMEDKIAPDRVWSWEWVLIGYSTLGKINMICPVPAGVISQDEDGNRVENRGGTDNAFLISNRRASLAEEELIRGRTKLRQAGKQIQGVICSTYKIERQATGLRDILGELPRAEASRFRSQVSSLASETKQERNALSKMITKISNYRISV
ncbi:hypothetical protein DKX38_020767 [Salix brachista]|uniref:Uncharacterized protein n=1 Tax=Salix brachista TaxID=2182728 RepID=A0A5N5KAT1_9ROSI|nr:hypothetical protein DKX38_020767 [Salix brachista]